MVRIADMAARMPMRTPPVIGSMGRFVEKKAFPLMVEALALLHQRGVDFRAVIGGGGDEEAMLRQQIASHGLNEKMSLAGWVQNKAEFFAGMDLFVLPSHHEPFGIVLIEAMAASVPVLSTASEGPREIIQPGVNGALTPLNDAPAMADALAQLMANPAQTATMGAQGRADVAQRYSPQAMAGRLKTALDTILTGN